MSGRTLRPWWIQVLFSLASPFFMVFSILKMSTTWVTILEILPCVTTGVQFPAVSDHLLFFCLLVASKPPGSQILTKVLFLSNSLPLQFDFFSRLHRYGCGSQVFKESFKATSRVLVNQLIQDLWHVKSVSLPDLPPHCQSFC